MASPFAHLYAAGTDPRTPNAQRKLSPVGAALLKQTGPSSDPRIEQAEKSAGVSSSEEVLMPKRQTHFKLPDGTLKPLTAPSGERYLLKNSGWRHPRDPKTNEPVLVNEQGEARSIYDDAPRIKKDGKIYAAPAGYEKKEIGVDPDFNPNAMTKEQEKANAAKQKEDEKALRAAEDHNLAILQAEVSQQEADGEIKSLETSAAEKKAKLAEAEITDKRTFAKEALTKAERDAEDRKVGSAEALAKAQEEYAAARKSEEQAKATARAIEAKQTEEDLAFAKLKAANDKRVDTLRLQHTGRRQSLAMPTPAKTKEPTASESAPTTTPVSALPTGKGMDKAIAASKAPDIRYTSSEPIAHPIMVNGKLEKPLRLNPSDKAIAEDAQAPTDYPRSSLDGMTYKFDPQTGNATQAPRGPVMTPDVVGGASETDADGFTHRSVDLTDPRSSPWSATRSLIIKADENFGDEKEMEWDASHEWTDEQGNKRTGGFRAQGESDNVPGADLTQETEFGAPDARGRRMGINIEGRTSKARGKKMTEGFDADVPPEWTSSNALTAQATARDTGTDIIHTDSTLSVELPASRLDAEGALKVNGKQVGIVRRTMLGLPEVELAPASFGQTASPSYRSSDPFKGAPEYAAPSAGFREQQAKEGNPFNADKPWREQRWGDKQVAEFIENWNSFGDAERRKLMDSDLLKDMEGEMPSARDLFMAGRVSLQQARQIDQAVYGRSQKLPDYTESWEAWRQGNTPAAVRAREVEKQWVPGIRGSSDREQIAARQRLLTEWQGEYRKRHGNQPDFDPKALQEASQAIAGDQSTALESVVATLEGVASSVAGSAVGIAQTVLKDSPGANLQIANKPKIEQSKIDAVREKQKVGKELNAEEKRIAYMVEFADGLDLTIDEAQSIRASAESDLIVEKMASDVRALFSKWREHDEDPRNVIVTSPDAAADAMQAGERAFGSQAQKDKAVADYLERRERGEGNVLADIDLLKEHIDNGTLNNGLLKSIATRIKSKSADNIGFSKRNKHLGSEDLDKVTELDRYDVTGNTNAGQLLAAYEETRDPAYIEMLKSLAYTTADREELLMKTARFASMNGLIQDSDSWGAYEMTKRGIQVDAKELAIEVGGMAISGGISKLINPATRIFKTAGKAGVAATRVERALARTDNVLSMLQNSKALSSMKAMSENYAKAGIKLNAPFYNKALGIAKEAPLQGISEGMQGASAAMFEEDRAGGEILKQAALEAMGGPMMSVMNIAPLAGLSAAQRLADNADRQKLSAAYADWWNKNNPESPITAGDAMGIRQLIDKRDEDEVRARSVFALEALKAWTDANEGPPPPALLQHVAQASYDAYRLQQVAVQTYQELEGIGDKRMKAFVKAGLRTLTGQPLTTADQQALGALNAAGEPLMMSGKGGVIFTDAGLAEVAQAAPGIRQRYFPESQEAQELIDTAPPPPEAEAGNQESFGSAKGAGDTSQASAQNKVDAVASTTQSPAASPAEPKAATSDQLTSRDGGTSETDEIDAELDRKHAEWQAGKKEVDDAYDATEPHSQERKEAREKRKQWEEKNGQTPPPSSNNPLFDLGGLSNKDSDTKFSLAGTGWRLTGAKEMSARGKPILYVTNGKTGAWVEEGDLTDQHRQILARSSGTSVDKAAHDAASSPTNNKREPTPAEIEAGNYAKGHPTIGGVKISIENPVGSKRSGKDANGKSWEVQMSAHYGYMRGTVGADGDHIDVFVKPGTPEDFDGMAFVIPQRKPDGSFDEHKVMIGYASIEEAKKAYKAHYAKGWKGYRPAMPVPMSELAQMVKSGKLKKPNQRPRTNETTPGKATSSPTGTTPSNTDGSSNAPGGSTPGSTDRNSAPGDGAAGDQRDGGANQIAGQTDVPLSPVRAEGGGVPTPAQGVVGSDQSKQKKGESIQGSEAESSSGDSATSERSGEGMVGGDRKDLAQWSIRTSKGRKLTIPASAATDSEQAKKLLAAQLGGRRGELLVLDSLQAPAIEQTIAQRIYDEVAKVAARTPARDKQLVMHLGRLILAAVRKHEKMLGIAFADIKIVSGKVEGGGMYVKGKTLHISPSTLIGSMMLFKPAYIESFVDTGFFHEALHPIIEMNVSAEEAAMFWDELKPEAQEAFLTSYEQDNPGSLVTSSTQKGYEYLRALIERKYNSHTSEELFIHAGVSAKIVAAIKKVVQFLRDLQSALKEGGDFNLVKDIADKAEMAFLDSGITTGNVDAQRNAAAGKAKAEPIGNSARARSMITEEFGAMAKALGIDIIPNYAGPSAHYVISEDGKRRGGYIEINPVKVANWSPGQMKEAMREEMIHAIEDRALVAEMLKAGYKMSDPYIQSGDYHVDFFKGVYDMMSPEQIAYVKDIYSSHGNREYVIGSEFRRMLLQNEHYKGLTEAAMAGGKNSAKARKAIEAIAALLKTAVKYLRALATTNTPAGKQAARIYEESRKMLQKLDPRGEVESLKMAAPQQPNGPAAGWNNGIPIKPQVSNQMPVKDVRKMPEAPKQRMAAPRISGNSQVHPSAKIGPNADIWNSVIGPMATVNGTVSNARIEGSAFIGDGAYIDSGSIVGGNAKILGGSVINSTVNANVVMSGGSVSLATVSGNARILGGMIEGKGNIDNLVPTGADYRKYRERTLVEGDVIVMDGADIKHDVHIFGDAIIDMRVEPGTREGWNRKDKREWDWPDQTSSQTKRPFSPLRAELENMGMDVSDTGILQRMREFEAEKIMADDSFFRDKPVSNSIESRKGYAWAEAIKRHPVLPAIQGSEAQRMAGPSSDPLVGLPSKVKIPGMGEREFGPYQPARDTAVAYMKQAGMSYDPPRTYAKVNKDRAERIAAAFDAMKHEPQDQKVAAAYKALIAETVAQWEAIKKAGLKVSPMKKGMADPYAASPRLAQVDVEENNHLWFYPTDFGFGNDVTGFDPKDNPLFEFTGEVIDGHKMRANDVFRIVHDYFGHFKEGVGFRADGEENAWRQHAAMFSDLARGALTTETRGQNSWLNFGPFGEKNRTAKVEDTVFADQKIGLMPEWTWKEGLADPVSGGAAFAKFFNETQTTKDGGATFKDAKEILQRPLEGHEAELQSYIKFGSNFQKHIMASIPGFLDARIRVMRGMAEAAVILGSGGKEVAMLDITSSEGYFTKAWAEQAQARGVNATADALDALPAFQDGFNATPQVKGVRYLLEAWGESFIDPTTKQRIPQFKANKKYAIVHEGMGFQFFTPTRDAEIAEVKSMMTPDGLFVTLEKLKNQDYKAREVLKDEYKAQFFSQKQMADKAATVLNKSDENAVGMSDYQFDRLAYEELLKKHFKNVTQIYSSGNFAGYYATDSDAVMLSALNNTGDTTTKFNEEVTPRHIAGVQSMAAPMSKPYAERAIRDLGKLSLEDEGGDTLNLDGSKYTGGGVAIPVLSKNFDDYQKMTTDDIGKFINPENVEYVAAGGSVLKAGIYKFPNSTKASVDLNIIAPREKRDEGVKIAGELGQESAFDLDSFENIKTGKDGMNPRKPTVEEVREIAQRLSMAAPSRGYIGTITEDNEVVGVKVPDLSKSNHSDYREITNASEGFQGDWRYNATDKTIYWWNMRDVKASKREKVADWLIASGQDVVGHKDVRSSQDTFNRAHGVQAMAAPQTEIALDENTNTTRAAQLETRRIRSRATGATQSVQGRYGDAGSRPTQGPGRGSERVAAEEQRSLFMAAPKIENLTKTSIQGMDAETGKPISFKFLHNKSSYTKERGRPYKPAKDEMFDRGYEPSGQYMVATEDDYLIKAYPNDYIVGTTTFNNPIVIKAGEYGDESSWKRSLSKAYGNKTGKALSKAIIASGHDGIITVFMGQHGEIVDLTTFDESKALFMAGPNSDPQRANFVEPGFYSELQRTIASKMPNAMKAIPTSVIPGRKSSERTITNPKTGQVIKVIKATNEPDRTVEAKGIGEQMRALLLNADVTPDELKWSGLLTWLDGRESVTKSEVEQYLRDEGSVRFRTTTIGGSGIEQMQPDERYRKAIDAYEGWIYDQDADIRGYEITDKEKAAFREWADRKIDENQLIKRLELADFDEDQFEMYLVNHRSIGKHEKYTLPGGTNYREVVLAMPKQRSKSDLQEVARLRAFNPTLAEKTDEARSREYGWFDFINGLSEQDQNWVDRYIEAVSPDEESALMGDNSEYTSSHFSDVPNYVAHMRLNERTDASGKPGLFVEELQSDRHQAGRKSGYKSSNPEGLFSSIQDKYLGIAESSTISGPDKSGIWKATINEGKQDHFAAFGRTGDEARQNLLRHLVTKDPAYAEVRDKPISGADNRIPDAPFRQSSAWGLHLFKRALRDAVESGKEWIGWTVGDTQNGRYGLEKHFSEVILQKPFSDDRIYIDGRDHDGGRIVDKIIEPDDLADYVGEELAAKFNNMPWTPYEFENSSGSMITKDSKRLKGLDLKTGGEGMRGFYDTIMPREIGRYVKQWGAGVGKVELVTGQKKVDENEWKRRNYPGVAWDAEMRAEYTRTQKPIVESTPIWRVDITPQMRQSIANEGQALFMAGPRSESPEAASEALEAWLALPATAAELQMLREQALSEETGKRTVGDPARAGLLGSGDKENRERDAIIQFRKNHKAPEKVVDWMRDGQELADSDPDMVADALLDNFYDGVGYDTPEQVFASAIVVSRMFKEARQKGDPALLRKAQALAYADGAARTENARILRSMVDPHRSPEERMHEFFGKLISTPSEFQRIEIEKAPSPLAKEREIAELKAQIEELKKQVGTQTQGPVVEQKKKLEKTLEQAKQRKDRKTLVDEYTEARRKAVAAALKKEGLSEEDIFVSAEERLGAHNSDPVQEAIAMHPKEHREAINYIMRGYSHKDIAQMTKLPVNVVATIHQEFRQKSMRSSLAKWVKKGNTLFDTIQNGLKKVFGMSMAAPMPLAQARSQIIAEQEIERQLNVLVPTAQQVNSGKMVAVIVNGKNGQEVTIKVPFSASDFRSSYRVGRAISTSESNAFDKIYEYWISFGLLSGPETHWANVAGNAGMLMLQLFAQKPMEAALNFVFRDPNSTTFREFGEMIKGVIPGIRDAFSLAALAWDAEADPIGARYMDETIDLKFDATGNLSKVGTMKGPAIQGAKGRVFRVSTRFLLAMDAFFKAITANIEVGARAYRLGKMAQKKGTLGTAKGDLEAFIAQQVATPGSESWELAIKTAKELAFQGDNWLTLIAGSLTARNQEMAVANLSKDVIKASATGDQSEVFNAKLSRSAMMFTGFVMKFIFPFVKTPTNIIRIGARKAGLGSIGLLALAPYVMAKGVHNIAKGRNFHDGNQSALMVTWLAEQIQAAAMWMYVWSIAEGDDDDNEKPFYIVGSRPYGTSKPGEREAAYAKSGGTQVVMVRNDDGTYTPWAYGRYEPFATVLTSVVDTIREIKNARRLNQLGLPGGSIENVMTNSIASFASQLQDKSFFQGFANVTKAFEKIMNKKSGELATDTVKGFLQGFVPNIVRQPLRNADDKVRDSKKADAAYLALPMGRFAEPLIDFYGRESEKQGNSYSRLLIREASKPQDSTKAEEMIDRWNLLHPDKKYQPSRISKSDMWIYGPNKERRIITDNKLKTEFERELGQEILRRHNELAASIEGFPDDFDTRLANEATKARAQVRKDFLNKSFERQQKLIK